MPPDVQDQQTIVEHDQPATTELDEDIFFSGEETDIFVLI